MKFLCKCDQMKANARINPLFFVVHFERSLRGEIWAQFNHFPLRVTKTIFRIQLHFAMRDAQFRSKGHFNCKWYLNLRGRGDEINSRALVGDTGLLIVFLSVESVESEPANSFNSHRCWQGTVALQHATIHVSKDSEFILFRLKFYKKWICKAYCL